MTFEVPAAGINQTMVAINQPATIPLENVYSRKLRMT